MKKITRQFLFTSLSILSLSVVSCTKDDATGKSTLEVVKGIASSVVLNPGLLNEQVVNEPKDFRDASLDETLEYSYKVTIDKPQTVDVHVTVTKVSGSASEGSDFAFDKDLTIPAYQTTVEGTITIFSDATVEGDEDFTLQIGTASTSNATLAPTVVKFTIKNYLSPDLEFTFGYDRPIDIMFPGLDIQPTSLYQIAVRTNRAYDMDYYVFDDQGNDTGLSEGASTEANERLIVSNDVLSSSYLPDGRYYIVSNLFDDATLATIEDFTPIKIPTTVDYLRRGGITAGKFIQEDVNVPTSKQIRGGDPIFVVSFIKMNGVYTIVDSTYDETNPLSLPIASGKSSTIKDKIKMAIANTRKNYKS